MYANTTSTNLQHFSNCVFVNCTSSGDGAVFSLSSSPVNITYCNFTSNVANGGLGNDVYVSASVSYSVSFFAGSCSTSYSPKVTIGTSDQSTLLESCISQSGGFIASASNFPSGVDSNGMVIFIIGYCFHC
jgi:hypothetical protein